ncbi:hypothetical protein [uncultured Roseobacter sp.]|uniref:hypothetical protein n=1 Tax=uncultured Roseobacter sp. TaxID=114847 RepID=UPI00260378D4|nr:hypothetical protein [uncultured Roseobacter sp.]
MVRHVVNSEDKIPGLARRMPVPLICSDGPEGALIPGDRAQEDKIAVVYDKGELPPTITITEVSGSVQTVHANGVAVAVVARAEGPRLTVDDILLVERMIGKKRWRSGASA